MRVRLGFQWDMDFLLNEISHFSSKYQGVGLGFLMRFCLVFDGWAVADFLVG